MKENKIIIITTILNFIVFIMRIKTEFNFGYSNCNSSNFKIISCKLIK